MASAAIDEGRTREHVQQHALLCVAHLPSSGECRCQREARHELCMAAVGDRRSREQAQSVVGSHRKCRPSCLSPGSACISSGRRECLQEKSDEEANAQKGKAKAAVKVGALGKASPLSAGTNQPPR
eukprot:6405759-Amphidinium_carterae.2